MNTFETKKAILNTKRYLININKMSNKIAYYDKINIAYRDLLGSNSDIERIELSDLSQNEKNEIIEIYRACYSKIYDMLINS